MPLALSSAGFVSIDNAKNNAADGDGVLLVYSGTMSGARSMNIYINVEIDTSVGVRYEVTFKNGSNVMSHMALFYKFSDPKQSVIYNFITHQSTVNKCCESAGGGSNVKAVGKATIDSFACTHLQGVNNSEEGREDYWVSTSVPGYTILMNVLKNIGPDYQKMFVDGNIFQKGGLVRMTESFHGQVAANVKLVAANSAMTFPASDFDVP